ncbi:MAG: BREX-1 system adenine-specific DNA-methyltransferase PglX [Monoglobales bacterium]
MDKNAIKKFAVWARTELIARVSLKGVEYGITEDNIEDANADSVGGKVLTADEKKQRQALIAEINDKGYKQVMEEVAYTWFNRFSALRFMEVNGYLSSHVRVFTDEGNNFKPQIISEAIHLDLDGLDMEKVYELKDAEKSEELYKYLLIVQCNALNKILPGMFQKLSDYTDLLLPDNLLREGSVIQQMIELIPEEDWKDAVQIIGWLYQYYNSEKKDDVFAALKKNVKITKENIPAATQLFTPDWIVRYMVENSLGRLWLEGHPDVKSQLLPTEEEQSAYAAGNRDPEDTKWHYYLEEAEQEPEVQAQLEEIRKEYAALTPDQLKVIDPCSGSGHILAYMFDVLMKIYESYGYTTREAVASIVENNLYGLDIDDRAAQLAYFAVMMKARQYDRRFFSRGIQPHVYAIVESNHVDKFAVDYFCNGDAKLTASMDTIIKELHDAREYGSILTVTPQDWSALYDRFAEITEDINMSRDTALRELLPLVQVAEALAQKYDVVVTNPPYMGNMPVKMTSYIQKNYEDVKYDLYAVFIRRSIIFVKRNGMMALITQHTWMFISSFEKMRLSLMNKSYISLLHLGTRAFEEIGGEVVQTVAFVLRNRFIEKEKVIADRLVDFCDADEKQLKFLTGKNRYITHQNNFGLLPGKLIVYWLPEKFFNALKGTQFVNDVVERKAGVVTGNDNYFLRLWFEPTVLDISWIQCQPNEYAKYHVMSKGGSARRFYGNYEYVIKLRDLWNPSKTNASVRRGDSDYYFKKAIGWSQVGNAQKTFRIVKNSVCGTATPTIYLKNEKLYYYILAFLNTKIAYEYLVAYNPTINLLTTDICNLPLIIHEELIAKLDAMVEECIKFEKIDWDSFETSWDFQEHPLLRKVSTIAEAFDQWGDECDSRYNQLKSNQEELNRIFIDIYGLQDELTPEVEDKDVTVRKADLGRDIRSFISYAVGCMFGRYSLDVDGLAYAGGEWDNSKYASFAADKDNIIPICDDEYFEDDIVGLFVKFVKTVYGVDTLDENLKFIADALGGKGQPKDVIRNYFLNDFYKDHCKIYQKRPIYWLFDSGKKNGFKALIYMHRYQPDTIARIRTDYVHEQQARYRTAIADLEQRIANASTGERVKLNKKLTTLQAQDAEIRTYEEKIHHLADQMISIDLDDGVKKNYAIFQDVLAKIK